MKYIIYKIQIKDFIYIGSTQNFTIRKAAHKRSCIYESQTNHNCLVYRTIRDNGGWDCCTMVPIKEIEVETKTQARIAEEAVRIEYNAQMNMIRAYQTEEELKEYCLQWNRQYNQTEERKEYMKQYNKQYQQLDSYKNYKREYEKQRYLAKKAKLADSPEIKV